MGLEWEWAAPFDIFTEFREALSENKDGDRLDYNAWAAGGLGDDVFEMTLQAGDNPDRGWECVRDNQRPPTATYSGSAHTLLISLDFRKKIHSS